MCIYITYIYIYHCFLICYIHLHYRYSIQKRLGKMKVPRIRNSRFATLSQIFRLLFAFRKAHVFSTWEIRMLRIWQCTLTGLLRPRSCETFHEVFAQHYVYTYLLHSTSTPGISTWVDMYFNIIFPQKPYLPNNSSHLKSISTYFQNMYFLKTPTRPWYSFWPPIMPPPPGRSSMSKGMLFWIWTSELHWGLGMFRYVFCWLFVSSFTEKTNRYIYINTLHTIHYIIY